MSRKRILYFQQNFAFGAAENYLIDLARNVDRSAFEVHLMCSDVESLTGFNVLEDHGVVVHRVPHYLYGLSSPLAIPAFARYFRRIHPTLIHFNDPCVLGILAARLARVPVSVVTHHTPELDRRYNRVGRFLERLAFRTRPRFIFTSGQSLDVGIRKDGVRAGESMVIPLGLRSEWFDPLEPGSRARVRADLGIPEDDVVILNAARLSPQKRHDRLIEAAREVLARWEGVTFLVAGEGELRSEIEDRIQQTGLKKFHLLGHHECVKPLLAASDIFVMSSDFEGLCYAVIEASAMSLPVVATAVGGMRFSVEDEATGLLVLPGDPAKLAAALGELIADPDRRKALGEAGRRRADRLFSLDAMVAQTEMFYSRSFSSRGIN